MNKLCLTILTLSMLVLTACGGGSDDSGTPNPQVNDSIDNSPTPSTTDNNDPFTMKRHVTLWNYNDKERVLNVDSNPITQTEQNDSRAEMSRIKIGKREIIIAGIAITGDNGTQWRINDESTYLIISGANTAYANYGMVADYDADKIGLFYQGSPTSISDMKTQKGSVKYVGQALAFKEGVLNEDNARYASFSGFTNFIVDFDNKTINGKIDNWYNANGATLSKPVLIDAKIRANTFVGTANTTGYAEGKFYGPDAQNMAGAFEDKEQKVHGVFGAGKY